MPEMNAQAVADQVAQRSVGRMVALIVVVQFFAMLILSILLSLQSIDVFLAGSTRYIEELVSIGDYIEVSRHLTAAQSGGQIFYGELIDVVANRIIAASPAMDGVGTVNATAPRILKLWPPRFAKQISLPTTRGSSSAVLRVEMPVPMSPILLGLSVVIGYALLLRASFCRFSAQVLKKLVSPLERLTDRLTKTEVSQLSQKDLIADCEYSELNCLVVEFRRLWMRIEEFERHSQENAVARAIASTTQMLAHDVRKPFSSLKAGLKMLQDTDNVDDMKKTMGRVTEQVDRALFSVNGLIQDVMEIGSKNEPVTEPTAPESLVEASLMDILRIRHGLDVSIQYDFNHHHMITVEGVKVLRVFLNIIDNGIQAMSGKGRLWIRTREVENGDKQFIEFSLCNSGPAIPAEDVGKLFEAFYTKGKKGGTGLGLAIAHKIIASHGGQIWCESSAETGTEFMFTLPMSDGVLSSTTANLPRHSSEVTAIDPSSQTVEKENGSGRRVGEGELEDLIRAAATARGRKVKVLLVDDESLYLQALKCELRRGGGLQDVVDVVTTQNSQGAMELVGGDKFDVVVCDVDMGPMSKNGYELVDDMRKSGVKAKICVHSNRSLPADFTTAIESGADAFFPKPMSRAHVLKLIESAVRDETAALTVPSVLVGMPEVIVIEDDIFMREGWEMALKKDCTVSVFEGPKAFWGAVDKDPALLARVSMIVTDYYFDGEDATGTTVAEKLKGRVSCPVVLCSNGEFAVEELKLFAARIDKEPVGLAELRRIAVVVA